MYTNYFEKKANDRGTGLKKVFLFEDEKEKKGEFSRTGELEEGYVRVKEPVGKMYPEIDNMTIEL